MSYRNYGSERTYLPLVTRLGRYLRKFGHISPVEYRTVFGAERLAPRIQELRDGGMRIVTRKVVDFDGKTYTRYETYP